MRLTVLLLLVVFAHAIAAVGVPPITKAENWQKFHEEGGCFNDLFVYGDTYAADTECMVRTMIFMLPDFSSPYLDEDYVDAQYYTLWSFIKELSQNAFPALDRAAFEESMWLEILAYDMYTDISPVVRHTDQHGLYINANPQMVDGTITGYEQQMALDFVSNLHLRWDTASSSSYDRYDDDDYADGFFDMIMEYIYDYPYKYECGVGDKCVLLLSRINTAILDNAKVRFAMQLLQQKGFQIVTFDAADYIQESLATNVASSPTTRFAHLIPGSNSPKPEIAASRLIQAINGGYTSACMTYGTHHVLTFDGVGYVNQLIGDFSLTKDLYNNQFEVQVRNEWCPPHYANVVCTTGVAIRSYQTSIAFHYDLEDDLLAVTVNGELVEPGYLLYDDFEAYAIRHYPYGYDIAIKTPYEDAFNFVTASFHGPATVAVYPAGSFRYGLGGLCGTYDGCAADEFFSVNGNFETDADVFARSWQVHGGASIFEQPSYLANMMTTDDATVYAPFVLHPPLVPNNWEPWVMDPTKVQSGVWVYCSHFGSGALYDACVYETQMLVENEQLPTYLTDTDVILTAVSHVCPDMCTNGFSRMGGFTDVIANCSLFCDLQANDVDMVFDFPDSYRYRLKLPVATSNYGRDAFVIPPLGGDYVFEVKSTDCCDLSDPQQVMISLDCEKQVRVDAEDTFTVTLDEFSVPIIEVAAYLTVDQLADDIHVKWQFLETPTKIDIPIINQYSLRPSFIPQTSGDYIMQVIATDGCSISADTLTVTVECYDRDYKLRSYQSDSMVFIYDNNNFPEDTVFSTSYLYLDESCLAPIGVSTEWTEFPWSFTPITWEVNLTQVSDRPLKMDIDTDVDFYGSEITEYTLYWLIDEVLGMPDVTIDITEDILPLPPHVEYWYIPSEQHVPQYEYQIIRAEARSKLTQDALAYYRTTSGVYTNFLYWMSVECWLRSEITFATSASGTTTSKLALSAQNAYRELESPFDFPQYYSIGMEELPEWLNATSFPMEYSYSEENFFFHTGHCPGQYHVQVTLDDDFACNKGVDDYLIDVTCVRRPMPLVLTPCVTIIYDYLMDTQTGAFPLAYLLGADSQVPAYRDLLWQWFITPYNASILTYDDTTGDMDVWSPTGLSFDMNENVLFDRDSFTNRRLLGFNEIETYTGTLLLTDHCMNMFEWIDFSYQCHANVDARIRVDAGSLSSISIPSGNTILYANDSATLAWRWGAVLSDVFAYYCADETDANLLAFWDLFRNCPNIPYTRCAFSGQQTDPQTVTFTANYRGTATAIVKANDQCAYDTDSVNINVACDNTWPGFTVTSQPVSTYPNFIMRYTQAANGAGTWDDVTFTATTSATGAQFYWFDLVNDVDGDYYDYNGVNANDFPVIITDISGNYSSYGVVGYDGCNYDYKEFTITPQCSGVTITTPSLAWGGNYPFVYANNASLYDSMDVIATCQANVQDVALVWFTTDDACVDVTQNGLTGTLVFDDTCDDVVGERYVTITVWVDDGCQPRTHASIILMIHCQYDVIAVATTELDPVVWDNNRFPVVCLDGSSSTWNRPDWHLPYFGFYWYFTATPDNSVFQVSDRNVTIVDPPRHDIQVHEAPVYDVDLIPYTTGVVQDYDVEIYNTILIHETRTTELISDSYPENEVLGACFRPDVEGDYELELVIVDSCLGPVRDRTVVHAQCNEAPAVTNNLATEVTLGERYQFEITVEDANDDLVYLWQLFYCEDDLTLDMSDYVTNAHGADASFIPFMLGRHCLRLQVTDGCTDVVQEGQFEVTCGDAVLPDPEVTQDYYKVLDYSGNGQQPLYMGVDNILPGYLFEWRLKGYQPRFAGPPQPSA